MNRLVFFLVLLHQSILSYGQNTVARFEKETFDASGFKPFFLAIKTGRSDKVDVHYKNIVLRDDRADTTKLGFVHINNLDHRFVFPGNKPAYLEQAMNSLLKNDDHSSITIYLYLKSLWLSQDRVPASLLKGALLTNEDLISNCRLAADAYLFDQSRSLLIARIDTTISQSGWIANCCNRILQKTLLVAVSIIESKYLAQTPAQETRQPQSGLNFPILLADQPKNGIYVTYKDFLNNDPSPAPFTAEAKTRARVVHSPRMPDSVIATCWGYCDETGVYMNINKDFYKLNRIQNTYDVLGPASVEIRNLSLTRAINFTSSFLIDNPYKFIDIEPFFEPLIKKIDYLKYYQLDIRTGLLK